MADVPVVEFVPELMKSRKGVSKSNEGMRKQKAELTKWEERRDVLESRIKNTNVIFISTTEELRFALTDKVCKSKKFMIPESLPQDVKEKIKFEALMKDKNVM